MQLVRTTLRLQKDLKKRAEQSALDRDTTLQNIFNEALHFYLEKEAKINAKKIIFKFHRLGSPLDNLTRDDFYPDPKLK